MADRQLDLQGLLICASKVRVVGRLGGGKSREINNYATGEYLHCQHNRSTLSVQISVSQRFVLSDRYTNILLKRSSLMGWLKV
jgi:hypothetical protein